MRSVSHAEHKVFISNFATLLGTVVRRSMVSANDWVRGAETYTLLWLVTLFGANHVTSNSGIYGNIFLAKLKKSVMGREYIFCKTTWNKRYLFELCLPVTQTSAKMGGEK